MRLLLHFAGKVFYQNLWFSLLATLFMQFLNFIVTMRNPSLSTALLQVSISGLTAGFALSLFIYFLFRRHELPMYRNHGISVPACVCVAYAFGCAVFLPVLVLGRVLGG
jgi:hypothetical protein